MTIKISVKTTDRNYKLLEQTIYCDPTNEQLVKFLLAVLETAKLLRNDGLVTRNN